MSELKPCPCCDADKPFTRAIPEVGIPSGDSGYRVTIKCRDCGCTITRWALKKTRAIESAEAAWNRRIQPSNEPLTLEQLREMDGEPVYIKYHTCGRGEIYQGFMHDHGLYGKTWFAYLRPPERSENDG